MRAFFRPGMLGFPLTIAAVMVAIELFDFLTPFYDLDQWGVKSWSIFHLPGIALMPLLHGGWAHLASNLLPFIILGTLLAMRGQFIRVSILGTLLIGAALWFWPFSNATHIGASGLVLCYFGFLLVRGVRTRQWQDLLISLGVALIYGLSMWATVTNFSAGVSWQGHIFGLIIGVGLGWLSNPKLKGTRT